mmetsp:Transcript_12244/g.19270  ORF Transcript_12244/g.19270 Transcript_12244/m.19270 type:complete len:189 (+) Transcript_12244:111-677(+)
MPDAGTGIRRFLDKRTSGWTSKQDGEILLFRGDWVEDLNALVYYQDNLMGRMQNQDEGLSDLIKLRETASLKVRLMSSAFMRFVWDFIGSRGSDKVPTSGFLGILWSLQACDRVATFGFGHLPQCDSQTCSPREDRFVRKYRYFERDTDKFTDDKLTSSWAYGHKWDVEEELHEKLGRSGLLKRRFRQ